MLRLPNAISMRDKAGVNAQKPPFHPAVSFPLSSAINTLMCILRPSCIVADDSYDLGIFPTHKVIFPLRSGIALQRAFYVCFSNIFPSSGVETLHTFHRKLCTLNGGSLGDIRSSTFLWVIISKRVQWYHVRLHILHTPSVSDMLASHFCWLIQMIAPLYSAT